MASPLSPTASTNLNFSTPPTSRRYEKCEVRTHTTNGSQPDAQNDNMEGDSSPFMSSAKEEDSPTISKSRPMSRILTGTELSPLKILSQNRSDDDAQSKKAAAAASIRSPRKTIERRFPVKVNVRVDTTGDGSTPRAANNHPRQHERQISLEDAIRENEGLKHAIEIFEDDTSVLETVNEDDADADTATAVTTGSATAPEHEQQDAYYDANGDDGPAGADDTMISTFSTFSAVPNLTTFAGMGAGLTGLSAMGLTPTPRGRPNPSPDRTPRAAPLPNRGPVQFDSGNTTSLMEFTEQLRFSVQQSSRNSGRISPSKTTPDLAAAATPQRQHQKNNSIVNLLDFDIPPLPTPRSIPTITPRELESLKSGFLSEISSLKASLSGKEAEVLSLKTAVGDAEKRVGECMEQLRESGDAREQLTAERDGWERRGREMEAVLRKVKEEIVLGRREREELEARLDEAEKRRDAAEMMAQEAESKMAGMRAGKASAESAAAAAAADKNSPDKVKSPGSNKEVEIAVERVARELHALYKSKHETKVAALKKSYENRWEKRVRELEGRIADMSRENDELRVGRDATMTRVDPARLAEQEEERKARAARDSAQIKELGAEVEKLEAVARAVREDNTELRRLLERERVEKGELVILAEEMMSMQSFVATDDSRARGSAGAAAAQVTRTPAPARVGPAAENVRGSAKRMSGIKAPGSIGQQAGESRIGRVSHERARSSTGASGIARPGSGMGLRSGIMSSIEKMGSYRGRGE